MPRPKRLTQFPLQKMITLLQSARQQTVNLTFPTAAKAFEVRATIYSFRSALKREGGHPQLSVAEADSVIVKVRGSSLILSNRETDDWGLTEAMAAANLLPAAPAAQPQGEPVPPAVASLDHEEELSEAAKELLAIGRAAGADPFGVTGGRDE